MCDEFQGGNSSFRNCEIGHKICVNQFCSVDYMKFWMHQFRDEKMQKKKKKKRKERNFALLVQLRGVAVSLLFLWNITVFTFLDIILHEHA